MTKVLYPNLANLASCLLGPQILEVVIVKQYYFDKKLSFFYRFNGSLHLIQKLLIMHMKIYNALFNTEAIYNRMESLAQLFYSNLPREQRKRLGPRFDGLVIGCIFRGKTCGEDDFRHFLHPTLINCYTFDPKKSSDTSESNNFLIGSQNGLSIILRSEPNPNIWYEEMDKTANSDSIRVAIYPHATVPFIVNKGVNLEAGKSTPHFLDDENIQQAWFTI